MKVLIANRGEVAVRIARAARALGMASVAVHSDADRTALHVRVCDEAVRIGPADAASSYLSVSRIVDAANRVGATHLHPGYGFLAENAGFAHAVEAAGLRWVGPHADAIEQMGSKIEARRLAADAGVPVIPGFDRSQDPAALHDAAQQIGYPVMIKASAGGGGKGIRVARRPADFERCLREAREESLRAFGDDAVFVERFIEQPRHIEVQVLGDRFGALIHLGTRECSIQRRHQKLIEEAPALDIAPDARGALHAAALGLARKIGYDNAGTVEFIVDAHSGDFFFLEMNTRLQVEHPVTERVTGIDLVQWQLRIASGEALSIAQPEVRFEGHAIEARLNAEDPWNDFQPQIGRIGAIRVPDAIRWDSGVDEHSEVSPHYDSMLAKLVAFGRDREQARRRLVAALDSLLIAGVRTNQGYLRGLLTHRAVVAGAATARFIDDAPPPERPALDRIARLAALAWLAGCDGPQRATSSPWTALGALRFTPHQPVRRVCVEHRDGPGAQPLRIEFATSGSDGQYDFEGVGAFSVALRGGWLEVECSGVVERHPFHREGDRVFLTCGGVGQEFRIVSREERWLEGADPDASAAGALRAPFPGLVTSIEVAIGDEVHEGDVVAVLEAMKMLHSLTASGHGTVSAILVAPGTSVESGTTLVTFEIEADPRHNA